MKVSIFLLLILLIQLSVQTDYSIYSILNYLQEKGYYDIIAQVKYHYGDDVAIDLCKGIIPSIDCKEMVRVYIAPNKVRPNNNDEDENQTRPTLEIIVFESDVNFNYIYILKVINKIKDKYDIEY